MSYTFLWMLIEEYIHVKDTTTYAHILQVAFDGVYLCFIYDRTVFENVQKHFVCYNAAFESVQIHF